MLLSTASLHSPLESLSLFFSFLADESDVSYYLLRLSGMEKGTRRTRRGHHVYSTAPPSPPPLSVLELNQVLLDRPAGK